MRFSVLMSLYVKEHNVFFNEAMDSIWLKQSLKPDEIILVLDGRLNSVLYESIDHWKNLIGDSLKILQLDHNVGLGNALNEGLKYCSNEWVFRMDTDDICTPDRFRKQIEFINNNPNIVLFGGQVIEFNQNINEAHILKSVPIKHDDIVCNALKRCPFNHMTVAYKKSVIQAVGGYQHHSFMEDYNLWLRVLAKGFLVANLPDVLLYARVGNGMHARRKGFEYIKSEKQLLDLKKSLNLQNPIQANTLFLLRSAFRLLPSDFLAKVYNTFLRKKLNK